MKIYEVKENKKQFISLLFLADEQEDMVDRYLERGRSACGHDLFTEKNIRERK